MRRRQPGSRLCCLLPLFLFLLVSFVDLHAEPILPQIPEARLRDLLMPSDPLAAGFDVDSVSVGQHEISITVQPFGGAAATDGTTFQLQVHPSEKPSEACRRLGQSAVILCARDGNAARMRGCEAWLKWVESTNRTDAIEALWRESPDAPPLPSPDDIALPVKASPLPPAALVADEPPIHRYRPLGASHRRHVPLAAILTLFVTLMLVRPVRPDRRLMWSFGLLCLASVATRFLLPYALIHPQGDDLLIYAAARGSGMLESTQHSDAVVALYRLAIFLWGDNLETIFLPCRMAGSLLPPLAFLIAWEYYGRLQTAALAGVLLLICPVSWIQSASISAEMIAAAAYFLALYLALVGLRSGSGLRFALIVFTCGALSLACILKPGFAVLAVLFPLTVFFKDGSPDNRSSRLARWLSAFVPALAAAATLAFLNEFHISWQDIVRGKLHEQQFPYPLHLLVYLFFTLIQNPPFLPYKLAFLASLRRPELKALRPLHLHVLVILAVFSVAINLRGTNQWRYALFTLLPTYVLAAPVVLRWVSFPKRHRVMCLILAVYTVIGYGMAIDFFNGPRAKTLALLHALPQSAQTLVLKMGKTTEMDALVFFMVTGRSDVLLVEDLYPPACPIGADLAILEHQNISRPPPARRLDTARCAQQAARMKSTLSSYDRIYFLLDPMLTDAAGNSMMLYVDQRPCLPLLSTLLHFDGSVDTRQPRLVPVRSIASPVSSDATSAHTAAPLWEAPR